MKLIVVGSGQCGGNIADRFVEIDVWARHHRGIRILTGVYAVNTDEADLSGLKHIPRDYKHRILLGEEETSGHGVGKINETAAMLARAEGQKIMDSINSARDLYETDAFLVVGSGGGGTGSGSISVIVEQIKKQHANKPVYALVALPYDHEEANEERTKLNTAKCLKAVYEQADAVFLVDNQRYANLFGRVPDNFDEINKQIVRSFRDILCTGEERKRKWIASRMVDAGDIRESLKGWTLIGWSGFDVSLFPDLRRDKNDFLKKAQETRKGIGAVKKALSLISLKCDPEEFKEAHLALYLFAAPKKEMNQAIIREGENYLKQMAPEAIIRGGEYAREKGSIEATVILSKIGQLQRIDEIYRKGGKEYAEIEAQREIEYQRKVGKTKKSSEGVPEL